MVGDGQAEVRAAVVSPGRGFRPVPGYADSCVYDSEADPLFTVFCVSANNR